MFIFSLTAAILSFICWSLAVFIFLKRFDTPRAQYLSLSIFFFSFWVFGNTMVDIATDIPTVIYYNAVLTMGISLYITFFAFFVEKLVRPNKDISFIKKFYYSASSLFFIVFSFTKFGFDQINIIHTSPVEEILGPMWLFFLLFYIVAHVEIFYKLIKRSLTTSGSIRNQTRYILLGALMAFIGTMTFDLVLPMAFGELRFYNLGPQFTIFFVGFSSYAIFKHKLLDIKIFVQLSLIYSAILFGVIGIYMGLLQLGLVYFSHRINYTSLLILSVSITAIGVFSVPGIELFFRRLTDKVFFKNKYNYSSVLQELSEILSKGIMIDFILLETAQKLRHVLKTQKIFYHFINERLVVVEGDELVQIDYQKDIALVTSYMNNEQGILLVTAFAETLQSTKLSPQEREIRRRILAVLENFGLDLIVPLVIDEKLVGCIGLTKKLSGEIYSPEDMQLLQTFSHQAAITLEKARLYQEVLNHTKNLEAKVEERTKDIRMLQESQAQMMQDISHELQTPLTIIKGELDLLSDRVDDERALMSFEKSVDRISRFISALLNLSKLDFESTNKKKPDVINFSELLKELVEYFTTLATQKNISVTQSISPNIHVLGKKYRLEELVTNIVSNAVKYIANEKEIVISLSATSEHAILSIQDTGIGISPDDVDKLFTRFYRTKENGSGARGTGLGLAICQKIVKNHGVEIKIKSSLGKGTTVDIYLPIIRKQD